jgi:hypothetical protein
VVPAVGRHFHPQGFHSGTPELRSVHGHEAALVSVERRCRADDATRPVAREVDLDVAVGGHRDLAEVERAAAAVRGEPSRPAAEREPSLQ